MERAQNLYAGLAPCGCFSSFKDQEVDFLREYRYWFLGLNWEQGFLGRCILFLKAHKTDEIDLTEEEALEKHRIYCVWQRAVMMAFGPDKINQSQLGNEEHIHGGHLHWHFVPRYRRPVSFAGLEFPHDTPETARLSYSRVSKREVHPKELRQKIRDELFKYL